MAKKIYKVNIEYSGRENIIDGTLEELINYFSYALEIGNSWDRRINRNPKTIKSFIINLQKSYEEKESACYNRTSVSLIN